MKRHNLFFLLTIAGFLLTAAMSPANGAQDQPSPDGRLSLTRVALFKSGVGFFQLRGKVQAGESVRLHFKKEQMNDLLKSLTVLDLRGGGVSSIVYDSTRTAAQALADYAFDLKKEDGLPQVLQQLQGSSIEMRTGSAAFEGTIVGVEKRVSMNGDTRIPAYYLSMLDSSGRLRSFNANEIADIRFLDDRLNQDVERYLAILSRTHRKDEKTLLITPTGQSAQDLLVSYVAEAPVWKATYRIVIPEENAAKKPFLQGWAIVDNVSGEDWKDIQLSLVSGLPVSFIQDLYDPRFRRRPVIEMEKEAAVMPAVPEAGVQREHMKMAGPMAAAQKGRPAPFVASREMERAGFDQVNLDERMREVRAETVTRDVGELFEYTIDHPVTIEQNRSALVPIVSREIDGEAVDLYNEKVRPDNPMAGLRLKNSTGLTLEGGPLTVLQGGTYAGDALIETLKPDEQRYITYAVDLSLHVDTRTGSQTEAVDRVIINRGVIRIHRGVIETKTYTIDNKGPRTKTVVIDHPYHPDWKLLNKEKPLEITDNYIRFEVKVPGEKSTAFAVREMRDSWERIMVSNLTPDHIAVMAGKAYLSEKTRQQLDGIVVLKSEISAIDHELKELEKAREEIFKDQKRVRENLQGLGQTTAEKELRNRYVQRLNEQETRLENQGKREGALKSQRQAKQDRLNSLIADLEQDLSIQ